MPEERLTIDSGETYTVGSTDPEEWYGATINGQLDASSDSIDLIDDPEPAAQTETATPGETQPGTAPISLPLEIDLRNMNIGTAIFIPLVLGLLLGAVGFLRNYAAGIMLMMAVFALIASGLLGLGLEVFWAMVGATVLLLIVGMVVRWST